MRLGLHAFFVALPLALGAPGDATAAGSACPQHYFGAKPPSLIRPNLQSQTRELCYSEFVVLHSGATRTPLYASERLTRDRVQAARALERRNSFHEDRTLAGTGEGATLQDYARSGFDRGHVAPSGNMSTPQAQAESFTLANMIPQNPDNNRGIWSSIESAVRNLAVREGELWVVTGPAFLGGRVSRINQRVLVPTHIWKAVYVPSRNQAGVYLVQNTADAAWQVISLNQLRDITGVEPFPTLAEGVRERGMRLPEPSSPLPRGESASSPRSDSSSPTDRLSGALAGVGAAIGVVSALVIAGLRLMRRRR